jgi:phosphatidylglycerol lysyltransferase
MVTRPTDLVPPMRSLLTFFSDLFGRLPFSASLIIAILATAAISNTLAHPISAEMLDRWGFGVEQMRDGRLYQVFLAPFQVFRPYMAISIAAMVLLFVGACEFRLGTARAVGAFLSGHIVGYLGATLVLLLLVRLGLGWATKVYPTTDVGASSGAFGAGGAVLVFLGGRARRIGFLLVSVFLVFGLFREHRIWDLGHPLAFAAGLAVGRVYLWRLGRRWPGLLPAWQIERRQRPGLISWALGVTGTVNILAAFLLPHHPGFARVETWLPFGSPQWPRHLLLVTGLVLVTLTPGLSRGQRSAWWTALSATVLSLFLHLQVGITRLEATLAAALLILLVAWRRDFRAPAHPPSLRSGMVVLASLVFAVPLYGLVGFYILRSRFDPPVSLGGAAVETLSRLFFFSPQTFVASGRPAAWFLTSIPLIAWLGVVYAIARIVRSSLAPPASPDEINLARQLLRAHGNAATAYMTLWRGNSLFFDPGRQGYVAYRVNSGVAIALGDPIGPSGACPGVIRAFTRHAEEHGWIPVFYATTDAFLEDYEEAGYERLQIGEEAVIPLIQLEFQGKEWQNVRTAINRAQREGVSFGMFEGGTIPRELRAQLLAVSAEWSARQELPPMGFTLGTVEDVDDPNVNVAVAVDRSGRVHGFVDWLPVYGRRGWVVDLMRHRDDAINGVMDFLIGTSLLTFKERGYETASLATAPLADLDRAEASSLLQWVLGKVYERSQTYYDFRALFRYKEKFQPRWESIYLVHRGLTTLPAVAVALTRAYLPDLRFTDATKILGGSAARWLFPSDTPTR